MMKVWTQIPTWGIIVIIIGVVFILATIAFIILLKRYLKRKKEFCVAHIGRQEILRCSLVYPAPQH